MLPIEFQDLVQQLIIRRQFIFLDSQPTYRESLYENAGRGIGGFSGQQLQSHDKRQQDGLRNRGESIWRAMLEALKDDSFVKTALTRFANLINAAGPAAENLGKPIDLLKPLIL